MRARSIICIGFPLLLTLAVFAQISGTGTAGVGPKVSADSVLMGPAFPGPDVVGEPYSAEEVTERSQTLVDGTHIEQESQSVRIFRDSQGRTRLEHSLPTGIRGSGSEEVVRIEIRDTVAGFLYVFDGKRHFAHRLTLLHGIIDKRLEADHGTLEVGAGKAAPQAGPPGTRPRPMTRVRPGESGPQFSSEPLGTQMIEGLSTEGTRITTTYPTGWEGNDRPSVRSCEHWTSPEFKLIMLAKCSDPRTGDVITRVINMIRLEPDATLFQVPAGYKIVKDDHRSTFSSPAQP